MFLEHKLLYRTSGPVPEGAYHTPLGVAEVVREGKDLTIVATGIEVSRSLEAAALLSERGIEATVVDPRTLTPLDTETIFASASVRSRR